MISGYSIARDWRIFHVVAAALALALVCVCPAWADVRPDDMVAGKTVEERGLDESACPDIEADIALVMDANGTVYFARAADEPAPIASITKIMTSIVALENASLDTAITVNEDAASIGNSTAGLVEGDTLTLDMALRGMLVPSGNDAALAVAYSIGDTMTDEENGGYYAFVSAMNKKAADLGCKDTKFTNPHGADWDEYKSDAHSTASDVALMTAYAMSFEEFRSVVGQGDATIEVENDGSTRSITLSSTNDMLDDYDDVIGVKTGTTDAAGYCFVGASSRDGLELYTVVLQDSSSQQRFDDTRALMDYVYGNMVTHRLVNSTGVIYTDVVEGYDEVPLVAKVAHPAWDDRTFVATVDSPDLSATVFEPRGAITQLVEYNEILGDVKAGDVVGRITYYQDGDLVAGCNIIAAQDCSAPDVVARLAMWWRGLFDKSDWAKPETLTYATCG